MLSFLARLAGTALAVLAATYLFSGIKADTPGAIIVVALLLGVINTFVKPVLFVVAFPFYVMSLGLLTFVVNGLILWGLGHFVQGFHVDGLWTAVKGAFVISLVSWCINMMMD